jgi:hypothetical protein
MSGRNVIPFRLASSNGNHPFLVRNALTGVVRALEELDGSPDDVDQYARLSIAAEILIDRLNELLEND